MSNRIKFYDKVVRRYIPKFSLNDNNSHYECRRRVGSLLSFLWCTSRVRLRGKGTKRPRSAHSADNYSVPRRERFPYFPAPLHLPSNPFSRLSPCTSPRSRALYLVLCLAPSRLAYFRGRHRRRGGRKIQRAKLHSSSATRRDGVISGPARLGSLSSQSLFGLTEGTDFSPRLSSLSLYRQRARARRVLFHRIKVADPGSLSPKRLAAARNSSTCNYPRDEN